MNAGVGGARKRPLPTAALASVQPSESHACGAIGDTVHSSSSSSAGARSAAGVMGGQHTWGEYYPRRYAGRGQQAEYEWGGSQSAGGAGGDGELTQLPGRGLPRNPQLLAAPAEPLVSELRQPSPPCSAQAAFPGANEEGAHEIPPTPVAPATAAAAGASPAARSIFSSLRRPSPSEERAGSPAYAQRPASLSDRLEFELQAEPPPAPTPPLQQPQRQPPPRPSVPVPSPQRTAAATLPAISTPLRTPIHPHRSPAGIASLRRKLLKEKREHAASLPMEDASDPISDWDDALSNPERNRGDYGEEGAEEEAGESQLPSRPPDAAAHANFYCTGDGESSQEAGASQLDIGAREAAAARARSGGGGSGGGGGGRSGGTPAPPLRLPYAAPPSTGRSEAAHRVGGGPAAAAASAWPVAAAAATGGVGPPSHAARQPQRGGGGGSNIGGGGGGQGGLLLGAATTPTLMTGKVPVSKAVYCPKLLAQGGHSGLGSRPARGRGSRGGGRGGKVGRGGGGR